MRRGFTLLEVMIASSILIVVFIVIYALFSTSDTSYRSETSLRTAQINAQRVVDEFVNEAAESGKARIWSAGVSIMPANPAKLSKALVFVSARDAAHAFILNGMQPNWQKTVAILPLPATDGTFALWRFELAPATTNQMGCASVTATVSATTLTIQFLDALGNPIDAGPSVALSAGRRVLNSDLIELKVESIATAGTNDGNQNLDSVMQIGIQIEVRPPQGKAFQTGYVTSIRGRN
jgi:prepilin-type N-terminal cleavage/methylation domain-containing protein